MKTIVGASAALLVVNLCFHSPSHAAGSYDEISKKAENSARWGLFGSAIDSYREVIGDPSQQGNHAKARLRLIQLYLDREDLASAKAEIEALERDAPDSPEVAKLTKHKKKIKKLNKLHKFNAKVQLSMLHDTDTSVASAGGHAKTPSFAEDLDEDEEETDEETDEEEEDEDDFEDDFEDDDSLEDLLDEVELDEDDIEEFVEGAVVDEETELNTDDADGDAEPLTRRIMSRATRSAAKTVHDNRLQTGLALRYGYAYNERGDRWNAGLNATRSDQEDQTQLERQNWAFSTGPVIHVPMLGMKVNPSVTYLQLYKDSGYELATTVYSLAASHKLNRTLELSARYNYETRDFNEEDAPEVDIDALKVAANFKPTSKDSFKLSYSPKVEDNSQRAKNKDQSGWAVAYARKLPWESFASITYSLKKTDLVNDPKGTETEEDKVNFSVGHKITKKLVVSAGYEHKEKDSNQPRKDSNNETTVLNVIFTY